MNTPEKIFNRSLILPYCLPYFVYVLIITLFSSLLSLDLIYLLEIFTVVPLIAWGWDRYLLIKGPNSISGSIIIGIAVGLIGLFIWVILVTPFAGEVNNEPWSRTAFILRLSVAGLIVPFFEELLMRGFIFRFVLQWDIARQQKIRDPLGVVLDEKSVNDVAPGAWSCMAVAISTLLFASGHHPQEWVAAAFYGLMMCLLWIVRKDLIASITAHAVTNISLAFYVLHSGRWYLW